MKPPPVVAADEIVRLDPPVFERVKACVLLLPTAMLPKSMEAGATARVPEGSVPVPLRETVTDGFDAVDAMTRLALFVPALVGEKVTYRLALAPAARE